MRSDSAFADVPGTPNSVPLPPRTRSTTSSSSTDAGTVKSTFARLAIDA